MTSALNFASVETELGLVEARWARLVAPTKRESRLLPLVCLRDESH